MKQHHLERQRYILFEYISLDSTEYFNEKEMTRAIWSSMVKLFGDYPSYKSGLWMVEFNSDLKWGIIRCTNKTKEMVISAIAFTNEVKSNRIIFHTIRTSGTIRVALRIQKEYFQNYRT